MNRRPFLGVFISLRGGGLPVRAGGVIFNRVSEINAKPKFTLAADGREYPKAEYS